MFSLRKAPKYAAKIARAVGHGLCKQEIMQRQILAGVQEGIGCESLVHSHQTARDFQSNEASTPDGFIPAIQRSKFDQYRLWRWQRQNPLAVPVLSKS